MNAFEQAFTHHAAVEHGEDWLTYYRRVAERTERLSKHDHRYVAVMLHLSLLDQAYHKADIPAFLAGLGALETTMEDKEPVYEQAALAL